MYCRGPDLVFVDEVGSSDYQISSQRQNTSFFAAITVAQFPPGAQRPPPFVFESSA